MGVEGRDVGVGIELVLVAVLRLAPDKRDCGLLIPVFMVLTVSGLPRFMRVGEGLLLELASGRYARPEGLDVRLLSRLLSFGGEGESSMMSTHPVESLFFPFSLPLSFERRESILRCTVDVETPFSSMLLDLDDLPEERPSSDGTANTLLRPITLGLRRRGTRVNDFCRLFSILARIADAICMVLLLLVAVEVALVVELVEA